MPKFGQFLASSTPKSQVHTQNQWSSDGSTMDAICYWWYQRISSFLCPYWEKMVSSDTVNWGVVHLILQSGKHGDFISFLFIQRGKICKGIQPKHQLLSYTVNWLKARLEWILQNLCRNLRFQNFLPWKDAALLVLAVNNFPVPGFWRAK